METIHIIQCNHRQAYQITLCDNPNRLQNSTILLDTIYSDIKLKPKGGYYFIIVTDNKEQLKALIDSGSYQTYKTKVSI